MLINRTILPILIKIILYLLVLIFFYVGCICIDDDGKFIAFLLSILFLIIFLGVAQMG